MEESKKAGMRRLTDTVSVLPLKCMLLCLSDNSEWSTVSGLGGHCASQKHECNIVQVLAMEDFVWLVALYWWYLYMLQSSLQSSNVHFNAVYNWHGGMVLPYHCFVGGRL